jgi:hypothetical protein
MQFDSVFLKTRYDYELDRRDKLTTALAMPVGLLTVFGGSMTAMARSFTYQDQRLTIAFLVFLVLGVCAFFGCAWRLWHAYSRQTYEYLPLLSELREAQREWRLFFEEAHAPGADEAFGEEFDTRIIKAADENTRLNDNRAGWIHQSRQWLLAVFCFTALAGIPYVADQVRF